MDRPLARLGSLSLALGLVAVALAQVDARTLLGVSVWAKPAKFGAAIGVYLWTAALVLPLLPATRLRRAVSAAIGGSMAVELVCLFVQAGRGVRSHFNVAAAFDAGVFSAMGLAILVNTAAAAVAAALSLRARLPLPAPAAWGVRLGWLLLLLGSLEGAVMIARLGHSVGAPDGGPGLAVVGWSRVAGDLRVAHFVGMHGFQALPLLGWLVRGRGRAGVALVVGAALVGAGVFAFTLAGALAGRPLL